MYSKNWVGQVHFENFDFLVKVKSPLDQSIFFFFFFFVRRFGSGSNLRVGPGQTGQPGSWRHPWRHKPEARVSARWMCGSAASARVSAWNDAGDHRTFWWRVPARGSSFGPVILGFCRSGHAGSSGSFCFLKWSPDLSRSGGLSHGSSWARGRAWWRVETYWRMIFLCFALRGPLDRAVMPFPWNEVWICTNTNVKAAGHCWTYGLLVFLCSGRSDRAGAEFGLVGHEVGDEPSASIFMTEYPRSFQD